MRQKQGQLSAFLPTIPIPRGSFLTPSLQNSNFGKHNLRQQQCFGRKGRVQMLGTPLEVDSSSFDDEVLGAKTPVLVDFYADWCGPCQVAAPLMDWLATEYDGQLKVVKVDMDKNEMYRGQYKIRGLPTFGIFRGGEKMAMHEGALGKKELKRYVIDHIPELGES